MHKGMKPFRRAGLRAETEVGRIFFAGALQRVAENFGVERFLVAKMIVDRRDVRSGLLTYFPDRGGPETGAGEDFGGGLEQVLTRLVVCSCGVGVSEVETHV